MGQGRYHEEKRNFNWIKIKPIFPNLVTVKILLREKFVTLFIFKLKKKLRLYIKKQRSSRKKNGREQGT